ncbi:hypothetical protein BaRGS_00014293, partial [Batillaria attramentaria]
AITYDPACDPQYKDISPQHTMCIVGDVGTEVVLDQAAKDAIVQKHNDLREGVNPVAGDMTKMVWDDNIAVVAAKWARQCTQGHDLERNVPSLPGIHVGQNAAYGYGSFDSAIQGWYDEVQFYVYGVGSTTGYWKDVAHYTQVVNAKSQRIGCGLADCPSGSKFYYCNYAIGQYGIKFPYLNATQSCSECPNQCDASGKLCVTCPPTSDEWTCGPNNSWPQPYCTIYSNVKYSCPYMCGICPHDCGDKMCYNGGTMNYQTCQCTCKDLYTGDTCETLDCPTGDPSYCGKEQPYGYPQSFCDMYSNVPTECPHMCGVC